MDTALPQKFPFILDRNLAKANCTGNRVCTSCDTVVLGLYANQLAGNIPWRGVCDGDLGPACGGGALRVCERQARKPCQARQRQDRQNGHAGQHGWEKHNIPSITYWLFSFLLSSYDL